MRDTPEDTHYDTGLIGITILVPVCDALLLNIFIPHKWVHLRVQAAVQGIASHLLQSGHATEYVIHLVELLVFLTVCFEVVGRYLRQQARRLFKVTLVRLRVRKVAAEAEKVLFLFPVHKFGERFKVGIR